MRRDLAQRRFHVEQFRQSLGGPVEGTALLLVVLVTIQKALEPIGQVFETPPIIVKAQL